MDAVRGVMEVRVWQWGWVGGVLEGTWMSVSSDQRRGRECDGGGGERMTEVTVVEELGRVIGGDQ